jgi:hypothetical protein
MNACLRTLNFARHPARSATLSAAIACLLTWAVPAQAGRPLQTEDAGILDKGTCEVEGATARLREAGLGTARETSLQLACGVGADSQIALAASRASFAGVSEPGLRLGGKTEVWKGKGDDAPALAIAWGIASVKPAGSGWKTGTVDAVAVASMPLAGMTLHLNIGHERDVIGRTSATPWGIAIEHPGFGAWAPMAEIFGDDRDPAWWNLGLRYTLAKDQAFVDLSWGRQMSSARPTLLTAGFKFVF